MCGAANPVDSIFCSKCNARLVPLVAGLQAPPVQAAEPPVEETHTDASAPEASSPLSWIERLRASAPLEEAPHAEIEDKTTEPASGDNTGTPEWLARLRAAPSAEEESPPDSVPTWLQSPTSHEQETKPVSENTQPGWLQQPSADVAPVGQTSSAPIELEMPDWLKPSAPIAETSGKPVSAEPAPEIPMPDWLKEPKPPGADESQRKPSEESTALPQAEEEKPIELAQTPVAQSAEEEDVPDWLRAASSAEATLAAPTETPVPAWVASLKPAASPVLAQGEAETEGPLVGLRGVLSLAVAMTEPHRTFKSAISVPRSESARLFDSILAAPHAEPIALTETKSSRRSWTVRPFIYLLLALVVLVPFFIPSNLASSSLKITGTPAEEFYDTIDKLPQGSTVLLAFDYDPSMAGEMDLQARAIASHLVRRHFQIVALSTLETGPQIAKRILTDATRGVSDYVYGTNYVNLGYLAGHEAGLSNLAASGFAVLPNDFQNQATSALPATANIKTLRDVQLIIVLAGSDDALKAWMEQVQARAGVRIIAGVSAAVEPKARAYRDTPTRQLAAMLSGLIGAAQYEVLSSNPGLAVVSVNAQTAAQVLLVLIVVLGNLVFWFARARGRTA